MLNAKINSLQNKMQVMKSQQEKVMEQLGQLDIYKVFIDSLWLKFGNNFQGDKAEKSENTLFLTEAGGGKQGGEIEEQFQIPFSSHRQIPECLDIIEEQNLQFMTI